MEFRAVRSISVIALVAAGLVALVISTAIRSGAVPMPVGDVAVDPAGGAIARDPGGKLVVTTDAGGYFSVTWYGADGTTELGSASRHLRNPDKCLLDVGAADISGLIQISIVDRNGEPTGSQVGLVDNGMGSRYQNNCNRANGRLEDGEGFAIELGSKLGSEVAVDYAVLDIEGKHGAGLEFSTSLDGAPRASGEKPLPEGTDNTADNAGTDNTTVLIGEVPAVLGDAGPTDDDFDRLVFSPVSSDGRGDVSWEGGGDYTDGTNEQHRSVFYLASNAHYEYPLICWDDAADNTVDDGNQYNTDGTYEVIAEGDTNGDGRLDDTDWAFTTAEVDDVGYPKVARLFRYAAVGEGKPPCEQPIGVSLSADDSDGDDEPEFFLDPSTAQASLRVDLTWVVPFSLVEAFEDGLTTVDPFARQIDIGDGNGPQDAQWCTSFIGVAWDYTAPGTVTHPSGTPWCYLTDERSLGTVDVYDANGQYVDTIDVVFQRMVWDGQGDPRFF